MATPSEVAGLVLIIGAAWPALSPRVATGVLTTTGLFALVLAGIAYATCTGAETRQWLLWLGSGLVGLGEVLAWRVGLRWWWLHGLVRRPRPVRSRAWRD